MLRVVLLEVVLQASKPHPSPHRNTMLLKDGTTSKNILPRGLTSLLDSGKKKRLQLLGLLLLLLVLLLEVVLQASKTHPSPHQNTMLLKDETTSKSIARTSSLEAGTSLLKSYLLSYPAIVLESSLILLSY